MRGFGNFLWFITFGLIFGILTFLSAIFACITIIFIPIGIQYFKLSKFLFLPFGKTVTATNVNGFKTALNIIWAILAGWEGFLIFGFIGVLFHLTIIGIPFGKQFYKIAKFSVVPLGHNFVLKEDTPAQAPAESN